MKLITYDSEKILPERAMSFMESTIQALYFVKWDARDDNRSVLEQHKIILEFEIHARHK